MGLIIAEGDLGGHARSGLFERTFPMKFVIGLVAGASALCLASSALAAPPAPIAPGDEAAWGFYLKPWLAAYVCLVTTTPNFSFI